MTRTFSESYYPSTRASVFVAGLVTLSSVVTTGTEASNEGSTLISSRPSGTETEVEEPGPRSHEAPDYIPESMGPATQSFGVENQHYISPVQNPGVMSKLEDFRQLEEGWDGYGAPPIPDEVIDIAEQVATWPEIAERNPEVFPTGRGTVQFEFIGAGGDEAELEVFGEEKAILLLDPAEGEMYERRDSLKDSISLLDELLS